MFIGVMMFFAVAVRAQDADASMPVADEKSAVAPADEKSAALAADKPYASIIARNMFALVPIPPPDPKADQQADPPPKITPTGIMDIFGRLEALFKVAEKPVKAGQPPKDVTHELGEGDMVDDITVVKINKQDGIITFNNHGQLQELPLIAAKGTSPAAGGGAGNPGMGIRPGMSPAERVAALRGVRGNGRIPVPGASGSGGGASMDGNAGGIPIPGGGAPSNPQIYQPAVEQNPMTPEQNAFLIETQRKIYQQQGNPLANLLPPTRGDTRQMVEQIDQMGQQQ